MPDPLHFPITFQPLGKTLQATTGTPLSEAAAEAGIALNMPCGGEGGCGKCRVLVCRGAGSPGPQERLLFSEEELRDGWRLACQTVVSGPMTVEVPDTSLMEAFYKILVHSEGSPEETPRHRTDPPITKRYVELPCPTRQDDEADLVRLQRVLGPVEVELPLVRRLPELLRRSDFRGTAVLAGNQLVDFEPGDTRRECYAVAVDVGTTTLAAMLLDLRSGQEMAVASRLNPQTRFGDDVLSRIAHAQQGPEELGQLQRMVIGAIDEMIGEMARQGGVARERIHEVVFSGNTTMQHLLCGIDPRYLGEVPFVPATGTGLLFQAAELPLGVHPQARAYVAPVIGGFVGGDTVAGMLAADLAAAEGPSLLIDIGTNGEIALAADGKLSAAATAAGPAFEGARILHGMRGCAGAIEKVVVDGQFQMQVIGGGAPAGFCGSALIDLAAELLRHRMMTPEGRMTAVADLPGDILAEMRSRAVEHDGAEALLVADANQTSTGRPILLTQRDIRQLQLASGAIRAGVVILLKRAGLQPSDLRHVLIAGGFGNYIRRRNAQRIGLLPPEIDRDCICFQGNTSLAGARLLAISQRARAEAESLARRTEHVDLATDHDFQWTFADAMIFPSEP